MLKAIHAQESKRRPATRLKAIVAGLRAMKLKEAAKKVEDGIVLLRFSQRTLDAHPYQQRD